jgi:hypothetical protein
MHYSVLNRATVRVANTRDVSGRVTAKSVKHGFCAKKQSDLSRICGLAIFGSLGYDRCGGQRLLRLLALLLPLAFSTPVLLADDEHHDQDHRESVDPIVGSWIVHVTIDTLDPNPDHIPLPIKLDNVANLGADGNTTDFPLLQIAFMAPG